MFCLQKYFWSSIFSVLLSATQEAVGTGDPELLSMVIQHREYQHFTQKSGGMLETLEALEQVKKTLLDFPFTL